MNKFVSALLRIAALTVVLAMGTVYGITITGGIGAYILWAVAFELIFWGIGTIIGALTKTMDKQARGALAIWLFPLIMFFVTYVCGICPTFQVAGPVAAIIFVSITWFISLVVMRNWGRKAVQ